MRRKLCIVGLLVVCALGLVWAPGCGRVSNQEHHLRRAANLFEQGDYDRAEIECLNALRLEPTNLTALKMLGVIAHEQGRVVRAHVLLGQLRDVMPEDLDVRVRYGRCLLDGGRGKEARQEAMFVLERDPTNGRALVLFAESSQTAEELSDAKEFIEKLAAKAGHVPEYYVALGTISVRMGDVDAGERHFNRAVGLDPNCSIAHLALGNLAVLRNDLGTADRELGLAATLAPARSIARVRYADFKISNNESAAGQKVLEEVVKQAPDYLPAWHRLAALALAQGRLADCEGILKTILLRDGGNVEAMLTMAQLRVAQGQPAKAVAEIERAVKAYPGIAALHYRLALARLAIYDLSGAVESLKEALAIQPDYREAELLLAQVNIRLGSTEAAIRTLAQLLERDPGLVQAHILLADAYRVRGQLDEVHKVFEKVAQLYPTNPEPPLLKGLVLRQQGKAAEARACFEASLALAPNYVLPLEQLVQLDVAGKQFDAARARVRQYWERFPSNAYYPYLLGVVHLAETNLAEAEAALKKALELEPAFSAAESLLAQVYVAGGRQAEALGRLEQLIARNTNDVGSLIQLAELHTASSNYAAAATAYERVLAVNPGLPLAQNNLAWLYAQHLGRLDEAYELARRAYDSDPRNPYFADTFGWVLYRRGEYAHAAVLLGESARALPNEPEVWFHLGMAHYMLGEEHAARSALQKAVLLAGGQYWLEEARFRLAVLERDWTGKDAIAELDRELERDPRDPILLLRRARAWRTGGETEKAAQVYERLLKVQPKLVSALTELAQLYGWYLQNTNRALELARRARVLNPNDPVVALTLGRLAYRSGDHKWAYSLLNEGASMLTNDMNAQFDFALAAYSVGEVSNALKAFGFIIRTGSDPVLTEKAKEVLELTAWGEDAKAAVSNVARIRDVLKAEPDNAPALMALALANEAEGNYVTARDLYERVLRQMPYFKPAIRRLAFIYHDMLSDGNKAYEFALRAREAFPQDAKVARLLGVISYKRGEYSHAARLLEEVGEEFPNDGERLFYLGSALCKLKQPSKSKEALKRALELEPDAPWASEAKRMLAELN